MSSVNPMMFRPLFIISLTFFAAGSLFANEMDGFLDQHCFECHDDAATKGNLNLLDADFDLANPANFELWVNVHDRIRNGEMPPLEKKRPEEHDKAAALAWLGGELHEADAKVQAETGRVQLRRLNRVEYEHTLQDLLRLPGLEIKEMLPPDAEAHGFDNVGSALRISYVQMARYLDAAREALNQAAMLAPDVQNYQFRLGFPDIRRFQITQDLTRIGKEAVLLRQPNTAQTPWRIDSVEIPFAGKHTIRIHGRAVTYHQDAPEKGELRAPTAPQVISVYQGTRILGSFDLGADSETHEITAHLQPKEQIFLYTPTLQDWNPKWKNDPYTGPAIALEWIEFETNEIANHSYAALFGDLPVELWNQETGLREPPEVGEPKHPKRFPKLEFPHKKNRYHVVSQNPDADARRLLTDFMTRAFRQPFPESEVERYLALVRADLEKRKPFQQAMISGYTAILSSPDFLYFNESPGKLDDWAIANRLSYLFWRSMPDDTLRDLAKQGKLNHPEELRIQIDRLLGDPKSERFINDFTDQWLSLREIHATQPDEKLYPEFDDFLLESMVGETRAFFHEMVVANLPARNVVESDFVFANNVLADLYGIEGINGTAIRKVPLDAESPRGGLLTQASILKITANGTTTSPVMRGAWVLDHLLGKPAPPPPPDVPAIEPDTRGATTIRELLVKHRADPACAGCHAQIDPPGFALESFDVIGGWRERYRTLELGDKVKRVVDSVPVSYRTGPVVDPSATMKEGRSFADIHEFRQILLDDERQLARNLVEKFATYATGAGISFSDRRQVEEILDRCRGSNYGVRDLITATLQSELFLQK